MDTPAQPETKAPATVLPRVIADGRYKFRDMEIKYYRAVVRVDGKQKRSNQIFKTASQAIEYGVRWAERCRKLGQAALMKAEPAEGGEEGPQ